MVAELFCAMLTADACICFFIVSFRVDKVSELPTEEDDECKTEEAAYVSDKPGVLALDRCGKDENEGCEHHSEVPVIDSARRAATVLHKPRLEGAEEHNADKVADAVRHGDNKENSVGNNVGEYKVEKTDRAVERYPDSTYDKYASSVLLYGLFDIGGYKVAFKLLLATGAVDLRGEETGDHFSYVHAPSDTDNQKDHGVIEADGCYKAHNVADKHCQEENRTVNKLRYMKLGNLRKLYVFTHIFIPFSTKFTCSL